MSVRVCICFGVNDDFLCFFTGEEVVFLFLWRAGFRTGFQVNPSLDVFRFPVRLVSTMMYVQVVPRILSNSLFGSH